MTRALLLGLVFAANVALVSCTSATPACLIDSLGGPIILDPQDQLTPATKRRLYALDLKLQAGCPE